MQVVFEHSMEHLGYEPYALLRHFPGVPGFFFVSGFLIYTSYLNAPGRRYLENRFLRLFPALFCVTLGGAGVALVAHGWRDLGEHFPTYALWIGAQVTLGQAYNPALFRDVGTGVINGALWTLTTEILFYLIVPAIVYWEQRFRFTVASLLFLSFAAYLIGPHTWNEAIYRDKSLYDIAALTPLIWGWMFAFGMLAARHFDFVRRYLNHLIWAVVPLAVMIQFGSGPLFDAIGNRLGFAYFACYAALILWVAFATPFVRLGIDLSYGSYVWHLPVINLLLVLGIGSVPLAIGLTLAIASLSWFLVEKPCLALKRSSIRPVGALPVTQPVGHP